VAFVQFENNVGPLYNARLSLSVLLLLLFVAAAPPPSALCSEVLEENVTEDINSDCDGGSSKLLGISSGAGRLVEGKVGGCDDAERSVTGESWSKDSPVQAESVR
jgi:hypothetical protein